MKKQGIFPKALADMPSLPSELNFYMELFWDLSSSRQISGMGEMGSILLSEIYLHLTELGITERAQRKFIASLIKKMDRTLLEQQGKRKESIILSSSKGASP